MERCDNRSVGVIVTNELGQLALLTRKKFPYGIAPPAGHIDNHGSAEQAACDEVYEEIGIQLAISALHKTVINGRSIANTCRRPGGDHHAWTIYTAQTNTVSLQPNSDETRGANWYDRHEIRSLAERTIRYQQGFIPENLWINSPGLEPVWLSFLTELDYFNQSTTC